MLPPTVSSIFVFVFTMNQPATQDLLKMNGTAKSSPNSGGDTLLWLVMLFYVLVTVICIGLLATLQQVPWYGLWALFKVALPSRQCIWGSISSHQPVSAAAYKSTLQAPSLKYVKFDSLFAFIKAPLGCIR